MGHIKIHQLRWCLETSPQFSSRDMPSVMEDWKVCGWIGQDNLWVCTKKRISMAIYRYLKTPLLMFFFYQNTILIHFGVRSVRNKQLRQTHGEYGQMASWFCFIPHSLFVTAFFRSHTHGAETDVNHYPLLICYVAIENGDL